MPLLASIFLNDVLPIFMVAAVGFAVSRTLRADVRSLSRITFNALSPCLVFHLLVTSDIGAADVARMTAVTALVVVGIGLVARAAVAPFRLDRPALAAFLLVVMFSNAGNYGLPVVLFAFGREALAHASVYFVANAVLAYTIGVFLASAGRRSFGQALAGVLRVPAVYATAVALAVMASGVQVPLPLMRPIELMSSAALPAMLLVLGMQLERGAWPDRPGLVVLAVTLCLAVTPLIALGTVHLLGLSGAARQAAILQSAMPSAVLTTILALEFDVAPAFVTACVVLSTVVSPVSVTLLIAWLSS